MLVDAKTLAKGTEFTADVCVVGGGAAGITLALALARKGRTVTLLESGGFEREKDTQALYAGTYGGTLVKKPWSTYLTWSRVRMFGGSTAHWAGWCRPLDPLDFEARDWVADSGWPITFDDLRPWYEKGAAWLEIKPPSEVGGAALPSPSLFGREDALEDRWFYYSPPTRFGTTYREAVVGHPKIRLVLHANALPLVTNEAGTAIDHIPFRPIRGATGRAKARHYVLATGGVENARLLLNSNSVQKAGLGNEHGRVGRYFMDHPHVDAGVAVLTDETNVFSAYKRTPTHPVVGHAVMPAWALSAEAQRRERISGGSFQLRHRRKPPPGADTVARLNSDLAKPAALRSATLHARFEQAPNPNSRVRLTSRRDRLGLFRARLDWRLAPEDKHAMARTLEVLGLALARRGLGRLRADVLDSQPWPTGAGGCHHMGTTRMHADPKQGVVDAHCRMHAVENLSIAGSSVFTTGGYANPTYTIVALALRLAQRLDDQLEGT